MKVYSIFDIVAKEYGNLFFSLNNDTAIRSFSSAIKQDKNLFGDDLQLFLIGEFSQSTGKFIQNEIMKIYDGSEVE